MDHPSLPGAPKLPGKPDKRDSGRDAKRKPKIIEPNEPGSCRRQRLVALAVGSCPLRGPPCARSSEPAVVTPEFRGTLGKRKERESSRVYAIVRCGGRQEKVALDEVVTVDKLPGEVGSSITLPALLVVDGDRVISDPAEVGRYLVTADIVGDAAGPKINMIHYRNKTGYRRRLGHRQRYTQVRITGIGTGATAQSAANATATATTEATAKAEED